MDTNWAIFGEDQVLFEDIISDYFVTLHNKSRNKKIPK